MRGWIGLVAAAVGCAPEVGESEFESANLGPARVTPGFDLAGGRVDAAGRLAVSRDGAGWEVTVTNATTSYTVEIVSGGAADLSVFDGADARLAVAEDPGTGERSVAILDPGGAPLYLLEPVRPGVLTDAAFGRGLLGEGNRLGPVRRPGWSVELKSAWLRTDGAEIELLPGSPASVWLDDQPYRVVLLSAWDVEEAGGCELPSRLAVEVTRAVGAVDETPLRRDPAVPLVEPLCAAD
jgi:hypothetical protein